MGGGFVGEAPAQRRRVEPPATRAQGVGRVDSGRDRRVSCESTAAAWLRGRPPQLGATHRTAEHHIATHS